MLSIKTRATVGIALVCVALVAVIGAALVHLLREDFGRVAADQQYALSTRIAREIDARFESGTSVLVATASLIDGSALANAPGLRRELGRNPALQAIFDDVLVLDGRGRIVADYPEVEGRVGVDASDRAFFREVKMRLRPAVSEPLRGRARGIPIVQVAVPIFGPDREVVGVLAGVIRLARADFLSAFPDEHAGEATRHYLLTRGPDPVYVAHPNRARILDRVDHEESPGLALAALGPQGSREGNDETLYSVKLLRNVPWVLVSATPKADIFEPLDLAQRRLWIVSIAAVLAIVPFAWLGGWVLLAPLQRLRAAMTRLRDGTGAFTPVPIARQDEVGDLTSAFNLLMERRLSAELAHRESEARLRLLADNMPALISYLDADLRIRFANSCYHAWFGIDPATLVGRRHEDVFGSTSWAEIGAYHDAALAGARQTYEREIDTAAGKRTTRTELIPSIDESGRVVGVYRMTTDITVDRQIQRELDRLARRDALTGLHNRRSFEELLPLALARHARNGRYLALLFVDLDHFKAVNDSLGHGAGDEVLVAVAARISSAVRTVDLVARLAGDEFTLVLEGLHSPAEAERVATKVIAAIEQPVETAGITVRVSASVGIAVCGSDSVEAGELLRRADAAAYLAKHSGRGTFHLSLDGSDARVAAQPVREGARAAGGANVYPIRY